VGIPIGSTIGGHVLTAELGSGAMGAVYVARHPTLPRDVALKVLHPAFAALPEFRERFAREAELLSRLEHPNVVDVFDRGQQGDFLWMSMRYVPGPNVATALAERGPFPPAEAVAVIEAVGAALDHAHAHGLLHRDVKPANILLRTDATGAERAMLTDFGIAKDLAASRVLTHEGTGPATVAYAAPEQVAGGALGPRVDVYALGAVLFELLTGRRAFDAEEVPALMWAVVYGPVPDLRLLRPDLPDGLAAVVDRALAKDPADRFASCAELAAAARAALASTARAPETLVRTYDDTPPPPVVGPVPGPGPGADGPTRPATAPRSTPPSPVPPSPVRRSRGGRKATGVVVGVLVVVVAAVLAVVLATRPDDGTADPEALPETGTNTEPAGDPAGGGTPVVGSCLDHSGAETSCDTGHVAEVFSESADCPAADLLSYLGGRPGEDVLRSELLLTSLPGGGCAVRVPAGPVTGPSRDALLTRAGDVWRRCSDELSREVSCAEPHVAEVIFEQSAATEPLACADRADAYLAIPFDRVSEELRIVEEGPRCVLEVRGANVLTASLRRLATSALPLEAADSD
jgi:serine/threonine protein kinase